MVGEYIRPWCRCTPRAAARRCMSTAFTMRIWGGRRGVKALLDYPSSIRATRRSRPLHGSPLGRLLGQPFSRHFALNDHPGRRHTCRVTVDPWPVEAAAAALEAKPSASQPAQHVGRRHGGEAGLQEVAAGRGPSRASRRPRRRWPGAEHQVLVDLRERHAAGRRIARSIGLTPVSRIGAVLMARARPPAVSASSTPWASRSRLISTGDRWAALRR